MDRQYLKTRQPDRVGRVAAERRWSYRPEIPRTRRAVQLCVSTGAQIAPRAPQDHPPSTQLSSATWPQSAASSQDASTQSGPETWSFMARSLGIEPRTCGLRADRQTPVKYRRVPPRQVLTLVLVTPHAVTYRPVPPESPDGSPDIRALSIHCYQCEPPHQILKNALNVSERSTREALAIRSALYRNEMRVIRSVLCGLRLLADERCLVRL